MTARPSDRLPAFENPADMARMTPMDALRLRMKIDAQAPKHPGEQPVVRAGLTGIKWIKKED